MITRGCLVGIHVHDGDQLDSDDVASGTNEAVVDSLSELEVVTS